MTENKELTTPETYEGVEPSKVHVGDRLQFITRETGFNGRGLYVRTGTVVKVAEKTVRVDCRDSHEGIAVLRRDLSSWVQRAVRRVVTEQPTARTAADLPKGTRVMGPDGRLGTAMGTWTGRVTNTEHANYGREYTGVMWDKTKQIPWEQGSRPFVDELTIVTSAETDADEVPFRQGERIVHADGRCFKFAGVNPEDSSRILVERPTDGRVVSWLLSECRAEDKTNVNQDARPRFVVHQLGNGYFGVLDNVTDLHVSTSTSRYAAHHTVDCLNDGTMVLDSLGKAVAAPVTEDPLAAVEFNEPRCVHGFVERPADRGAAIKACDRKPPSVSVGVFSDEGCMDFFDCAVQASDEAARLNTEEGAQLYRWAVLCGEHAEQPKAACEECNAEDA